MLIAFIAVCAVNLFFTLSILANVIRTRENQDDAVNNLIEAHNIVARRVGELSDRLTALNTIN